VSIEIVQHFVILDGCFAGSPMMLTVGGGGGRKVPFHVRSTRNVGNIIEIEDAEVELEFGLWSNPLAVNCMVEKFRERERDLTRRVLGTGIVLATFINLCEN
jgi:hypothetical protein